jgi:16S rRNA (guanine1207-N2)-methyltransferase
MSHYYTNQSNTKSKPALIKAYFPFQVFDFWTDHGVFSKSTVDFGSRLLIETARHHLPMGRILDVGCGYGPIGIVLASLWPTQRMDMVDINDRAIALATKNAALNQCENVTVFFSDLFSAVDATYAMILSNPPVRAGKHIVHAMISEAKTYLIDDGTFWIVLQQKQGATSAKQKMMDVFGNVAIMAKDKGYLILCSRNTKEEGNA